MPKSSRSETRDKFTQQTESHDSKHCNVIDQLNNKSTFQYLEREKRIEKAAEISECQNFHSRAEDCSPVIQMIF